MRTTELRNQIRKAVADAQSSQELIRELYVLLKADSKRLSVAYLCAKAGIPSKGSLADAMSGRRKLPIEYAKGLAKAFGLPRYETKVFTALVNLENAKTLGEREKAEADLLSWKKVLSVERREVDDFNASSPRWLFKLFTTLPLIGSPKSYAKLRSRMADHSEGELRAGLEELVRMGLIRFENEEIQMLHQQIVFRPAEVNQFQTDFIRDSMREAIEQLPTWYPRNQQSFFESSMLTVKREVFLKRLPEIKEYFDRLQSDMEADEGADELICLNIQIYPVTRE